MGTSTIQPIPARLVSLTLVKSLLDPTHLHHIKLSLIDTGLHHRPSKGRRRNTVTPINSVTRMNRSATTETIQSIIRQRGNTTNNTHDLDNITIGHLKGRMGRPERQSIGHITHS